ncbi:multicopper oxidase-domain-containing protein [Podospora appendiculata]|uniref:Multicopper oxidase-domain-containing protein n=1 Tax=Podospora appendiculata TaxID=314037 RepID=A0AAE0X0V5_9PEZI|nr:multicopper oxidase-domain-containing protein [Podospora appendiculata]
MGFLKSCLDFILHIASPFADQYGSQKPLLGPEIAVHGDSQVHIPAVIPAVYPAIDPSTCRYPILESQGYELCNDQSRGCWLTKYGSPEFNIGTDYESTVPVGIVREDTALTLLQLSPDGQPKVNGVTFNGTYPGPAIEACWGDFIVVRVRNHYFDNGTTVHWHGIRQLHSNEMDGVNGVTQCPIPYGEEYVYAFRATQYGHTWYHSHYSLQYPDGVAGPLVIHGPTSGEWDIDVGPILISDWIHDTAFQAFNCEAYNCGPNSPPKADNIVVNGIGPFKQADGTFTVNYFKATFQAGKRHLLRLINGSSSSSFVFSIDNHTMTVVSSDLVAVEPYVTDSILLGIGTSYWIRTTPADKCNSFRFNKTTNEYTQIKETTAMIVYEDAPSVPYPDDTSVKQSDVTAACVDESMDQNRLVPVVSWIVDPQPANNVTRDSFTAALDNHNITQLVPDQPFAHWLLANDTQSNPLWIDFGNPTILDPLRDTNFSSIVRFDQSFGFVYLIIDGSYLFNYTQEFLEISTAHPIHLHGSDFVILAQNSSTYDPVESPKYFKFDNPARRDTAMLPAGGYLAISFKPDNPGAWLMHCHIAWHASSGLALQLVVRPKEIRDGNGPLGPVQRICKLWNNWVRANPITQTDSGI